MRRVLDETCVWLIGAFLVLTSVDEVFAIGESGLTLSFVAGICLLGLFGARIAVAPIDVARLSFLLVPLAALLCWMLATAVWSVDPTVAVASVAVVIQYMLIGVVIAATLQTPARIRKVALIYIAGSVLIAAFVVGGFLTEGGRRAALTAAQNPNNLARVLAAAGILAIGMLQAFRYRRAAQWALIIASAVLLATVALTFSRGAAVAVVGGIFTLFVWKDRLRARNLAIALAVAAVIVTGGATVPRLLADAGYVRADVVERLSLASLRGGTDQFGGRGAIWRSGLELAERKIIAGSGHGTFPTFFGFYNPSARDAHNIVLAGIVELGVFGLGLFLLTLASPVMKYAAAGAMRKRTPAGAVGPALVVFLFLAGMTASNHTKKYFWALLGVAYAAASARVPPTEADRAGADAD